MTLLFAALFYFQIENLFVGFAYPLRVHCAVW